jgi:response regulator of citrate/malate metabolism
VVQDEVDRLFGSLRTSGPDPLPEGMGAETLRDVTKALRDADAALSATPRSPTGSAPHG